MYMHCRPKLANAVVSFLTLEVIFSETKINLREFLPKAYETILECKDL